MDLILLFFASSVQNAAFTWVGRSRNSGDVKWHAFAAICANSIWFSMQILIWSQLWHRITSHDFAGLIVPLIVYTAGTTIGSCTSMALLLRTEKGKRKVGAR